MPLRIFVAASRLADAPEAEVVVFETVADITRPHAEVPGTARPRSMRPGGASFEASLREAPQDEDVGRSEISFHDRPGEPERYLRIRDLDAVPDLGTISDFDGVLIEGIEAPWMVERLGARLAVAEAEAGIPDGSLRVVPVVGTAQGVLSLPSLRKLPRLAGIGCDPERLAASLRCALDAPAVVQARATTVLAAAACGVPAVLVQRETDASAEREGFGAIFLDGRL